MVNSSDYTASDDRHSSEKLDRHEVALAQFELLSRQVPGEIAKIHEKYQSGGSSPGHIFGPRPAGHE